MTGGKSSAESTAFNTSVPAVVFQISDYPFQHGSLGAIRTLGRMGVKTYLVARNRLAPHMLSRYLQRRYRIGCTERSQSDLTLSKFREIAQDIGSRSILIPTDDEAG